MRTVQALHDIDGLIELVGGAPLIVKLIEGTQGVGVVLAEHFPRTDADVNEIPDKLIEL